MTLARLERILLFLVILFLPTQLGRHFWPSFSYIYSLKIDYLSPTLYFWDILVLGLLAVWVLQKPKINKLALNVLLFFLFTQVLSLIGVQSIGPGLVRLEQYVLTGFFGVYLASVIQRVEVSRLIYTPLILGILGESLLSVLQFLKGETLGIWVLGERTFTISTPGIAKFDFYGYQFLRPYATFSHPNVLAGYVLIALLLISNIKYPACPVLPAGGRQAGQISKISNKSLVIAVFLGMAAIFLAMSRAAILAGVVAALVMLRRQSVKIIIIITVITIILSPVLFIRFSAVLNFDNLTLVRREELMKSAWEMFLIRPLTGVGLNNFIPVAAGDLLTGPSRFLQPVHNILLLELAETGIIGLFGFLLLVGYSFRKISNFKFQISNLLPWIIILFLGMFDHYFLTLPQGYRLLFLVWGLSFSRLQKTS